MTARTHVDFVVEHGPHVLQPVEKVDDTFSRAVFAPATALADTSLSPVVRAELQDCLVRSLSVITDLH